MRHAPLTLLVALLLCGPLLAEGEAASQAEAVPEAAETKTATKDGDDKKCELVVLNLAALGLDESEKHIPLLLSDAIAAEIDTISDCKVVTQNDISSMMEFEAEKAACGVDSDSCLAEIAGALGVSRIITGSIGRLGTSYKFQVKLQNVAKGQVEARVDRLITGDAAALDVAAKNAARTLMKVELLDEPNTAASTSDDGSSESAADAPSSDEGFSLFQVAMLGGGGTTLLAGTGALIAGVAVGYFVYADAAQPSDAQREVFKKDELQGAAWASLAAMTLGLCGAGLGAGVVAGAMFVE